MNPQRAEQAVYLIVGGLLIVALVFLTKRYWGLASVVLTAAGAIVDQHVVGW